MHRRWISFFRRLCCGTSRWFAPIRTLCVLVYRGGVCWGLVRWRSVMRKEADVCVTSANRMARYIELLLLAFRASPGKGLWLSETLWHTTFAVQFRSALRACSSPEAFSHKTSSIANEQTTIFVYFPLSSSRFRRTRP